MTFHQLRKKAGHTQEQAARYIYACKRTVIRIEQGKPDKARTELYKLKLEKEGLL